MVRLIATSGYLAVTRKGSCRHGGSPLWPLQEVAYDGLSNSMKAKPGGRDGFLMSIMRMRPNCRGRHQAPVSIALPGHMRTFGQTFHLVKDFIELLFADVDRKVAYEDGPAAIAVVAGHSGKLLYSPGHVNYGQHRPTGADAPDSPSCPLVPVCTTCARKGCPCGPPRCCVSALNKTNADCLSDGSAGTGLRAGMRGRGTAPQLPCCTPVYAAGLAAGVRQRDKTPAVVRSHGNEYAVNTQERQRTAAGHASASARYAVGCCPMPRSALLLRRQRSRLWPGRLASCACINAG